MTILDTNVLSELMRPRPSARVVSWVSNQPAQELGTTAITEAEIFYGIQLLHKGQRRDGLSAAAETMFAEDFACRVFEFGSDTARVFAQIAARRRTLGKPISHADAQIASIARVHGATLATRNLAHFEGCGIEVVNPWNDR